MRCLKITLAYDGSNYHGWQFQPDAVSIQSCLETAIHAVTKESVRVTASGRTDAGVHALAQVASCELNSPLPASTLKRAINAHLNEDIRVLDLSDAPAGFHAIRDAIRKRYRYLIQDSEVPSVLLRNHSWVITRALDVIAMDAACRGLEGTHDFASFESVGSPRQSTVRTVYEIKLQRTQVWYSEAIVLEIEADGFLYNMVRNIVGTIVQVGLGKQPIEWVDQVLRAQKREKAGMTAPAQGLFLINVEYPESKAM